MRVAIALLLGAAIGSCTGPPPTHALIVRHPERKCALIAFSGCSAFVEPPEEQLVDEDAGFEDDAGVP